MGVGLIYFSKNVLHWRIRICLAVENVLRPCCFPLLVTLSALFFLWLQVPAMRLVSRLGLMRKCVGRVRFVFFRGQKIGMGQNSLKSLLNALSQKNRNMRTDVSHLFNFPCRPIFSNPVPFSAKIGFVGVQIGVPGILVCGGGGRGAS